MGEAQDELFCRIYVDGDLQVDELARMLAETLDGTRSGGEIAVGKSRLEVRAGEDYDPSLSHDPLDGFVHFPLQVELTALAGQDRAAHVGITRKTLEALWAHNMTAVASCDYEHALPREGYNSRSAPETPVR